MLHTSEELDLNHYDEISLTRNRHLIPQTLCQFFFFFFPSVDGSKFLSDDWFQLGVLFSITMSFMRAFHIQINYSRKDVNKRRDKATLIELMEPWANFSPLIVM